MKVLCVASDRESLQELKRATVSAQWELAPGATGDQEALRQLAEERPHVVVLAGPFADLIRSLRKQMPSIRVVADRELPGADAVVTSLEEIRDAVMARSRPGGPVR